MALRTTALALMTVLVLTGCGSLFSKDEDPDPPAELFDFERQVNVRKIWSKRVGDGTERLRLGLRPATDSARIYVAAHDGQVVAYDTESGKEYWRVKMTAGFNHG